MSGVCVFYTLVGYYQDFATGYMPGTAGLPLFPYLNLFMFAM